MVAASNPLTVSTSNAASAMHVMRYRVGMDTMYPKPTGEMSMRLRDLTKNGDQSRMHISDELCFGKRTQTILASPNQKWTFRTSSPLKAYLAMEVRRHGV